MKNNFPNNLKSALTDLDCGYNSLPNFAIYDDPVCGRYGISHEIVPEREFSHSIKHKIACVLLQYGLRYKKHDFVIYKRDWKDTLPDNFSAVLIDELLQQYPDNSSDMFQNALLNISYLTNRPSDVLRIDDVLGYATYSMNTEELDYVMNQFVEMGYVSRNRREPNPTYVISAPGWKEIEKLRNNLITSNSNQVFVAMWFDDKKQDLYTSGIEPAIKNCGFDPLKINDREHNNKICDEIIANIKKSKFLVADFTGNRGGVYYEAGFAHGLGIPVIWTVHEDHIDNLHFDTRQYNHIAYNTPEELRKRLENRIRATIT